MEMPTLVDNCKILKIWIEKDFKDNSAKDIYGVTSSRNILKFLENKVRKYESK